MLSSNVLDLLLCFNQSFDNDSVQNDAIDGESFSFNNIYSCIQDMEYRRSNVYIRLILGKSLNFDC